MDKNQQYAVNSNIVHTDNSAFPPSTETFILICHNLTSLLINASFNKKNSTREIKVGSFYLDDITPRMQGFRKYMFSQGMG